MTLIDKDALVAEIERMQDAIKATDRISKEQAEAYKVCVKLRFFVEDTLEVKEVDFGTEVYKYIDEHFNVYDDGNQTLQTKDKKSLIGRVNVENIAKHFFELGLSVSNSTKVTTPDIEDVLKENGVNPYSKEAKIIKESYYMALEKLKAQKGE